MSPRNTVPLSPVVPGLPVAGSGTGKEGTGEYDGQAERRWYAVEGARTWTGRVREGLDRGREEREGKVRGVGEGG